MAPLKKNNNALKSETSPEALVDNPNQLVGWLVSFDEDPEGASIELRSGRLLIAKSKIFENAIQLVAEDISTPHAAIKASPSNQVLIQDIFSTTGTYLTKFGSDQESKVEGPVEISNGDRIRFGKKTRFQVCLIHDS